MRVLLMTVLAGFLSAATLILPQTSSSLSDDISIFTDITVETMSLWISKKTRGHLYIGFGRNATVADVVLIFEANNTIFSKSCIFNGTFAGYCDEQDNTWTLHGKTFNNNGSWDAYLTRDIRIKRDVRIYSEINWIIAATGSDPKPTHYLMSNDLVLVKPFNIAQGKVVSESELPPSLSDWGTVTNGSLLTHLIGFVNLVLLLTFLFI